MNARILSGAVAVFLALLAIGTPTRAQSTAEFVAIGRVGVAVRRPDGVALPHVAVIYENGDGSPFHPMCTELARRGFLTLCAIERNNPNSGWEKVALDVKAVLEYARRQPGITKVVLYGHSGGGAVASFYQAVAENGVGFCQDPRKLSTCSSDLAHLLPADGVVFPDAHPGLGVMSLRMINPSLHADGVKVRVDPALDPFAAANGFNPDGPSHYSTEFQAKYVKAQAVEMNSLIAQARVIHAKIAAGALTDATADQIVIQHFGFANHLDELDPHAIGSMATTQPRKLLRNDGTIVTQIVTSSSVGNPEEAKSTAPSAAIQGNESFLSRGSVVARDSVSDVDFCTSNSVTVCNVGAIHVPVLFIPSGANTFIADEERMYEHSPAKDKDFIVIEGALHNGKPCTGCGKTPGAFANSETHLYDYIRDWINARF